MNFRIYEFDGFYATVGSMEEYFECNMKLLDSDVRKALFDIPERAIYTKVRNSPPTKYTSTACIKNSLIADGCEIEGTVENCIIFRDCRVEKGAVVKNSILMPHGFIAEDASVNYCIADKAVTVRSGKNLSGADSYPVYIGKNIHI